jgi:hypothetical protein
MEHTSMVCYLVLCMAACWSLSIIKNARVGRDVRIFESRYTFTDLMTHCLWRGTNGCSLLRGGWVERALHATRTL